MKRMIDDYIDRFYVKEGKYAKELKKNDYAKAKELAAWKEDVVTRWDGIKVLEATPIDQAANEFGNKVKVEAKIDTNGLADSIGVEMVVYSIEEGQEKYFTRYEFKEVKREGDVVSYELKHDITNPGVFHYGYRIFPKNAELAHRQSFAYLKWF